MLFYQTGQTEKGAVSHCYEQNEAAPLILKVWFVLLKPISPLLQRSQVVHKELMQVEGLTLVSMNRVK